MAKRKLTTNQQLYLKQIRRITNAYKTLEKRGYRINEPLSDLIESQLPKRVTKKTLRALEDITPRYLRTISTALSESGDIVPGYVAWREEHRRTSLSKQRAVERARLDAEQRRQAKEVSEGNIILDNVMELIERYDAAPGAGYLRKVLVREIRNYGQDSVARALANAPADVVENAQNIIFYTETMNGMEASRAIRNFINVIRGTVPTGEELRELGALQESIEGMDNV